MTPEDFKKELDELKMTILTSDELDVEVGEDAVGVSVEIDLDTAIDYSKITDEEYILKLKTCRNDVLYLIFNEYNTEKKRLTMKLVQKFEKKYVVFYKEHYEKIGTTFPDLCWYYSEGTTSENKIEVETKFREENVQFGDLSWVLPTRFIDNIIETINLINQSPKFFNGLLRDSIIYGPYFIE